jgi:hypothetical protein
VAGLYVLFRRRGWIGRDTQAAGQLPAWPVDRHPEQLAATATPRGTGPQ